MADETILTAGETPPTTPPTAEPAGESKPAESTPPPETGDSGEGKPAEGKPASTVPEKYELKLPDNAVLQAVDVEETAALAKELGLSNEAAQKLLDKRNQDRASFIEGQQEFLATSVATWENAVKADPEIIGDKGQDFKTNINLAQQALQKFGTPEFVKALKETGYGSHPEVVRFMVRIGKAMRDDVMHEGRAGGPGKPRDMAEKFYGPQQ
jgi:hypothetical protein